jgi:hypothetical protein
VTAFLAGILTASIIGSAGADPVFTVVTVHPSWSARTASHPYRPGPYGPEGRPGDPFEIHIDGRLIAPLAGDWFLCVRSAEGDDLLAWGDTQGKAFRSTPVPQSATGSGENRSAGGRPPAGLASLSAAQPIPTSILAVSNATAYPNPFNPFLTDVTLAFSLNQDAAVTVYIYDWAGRFVDQLDMGALATGPHSTAWGGQTQDGRALGNGTYLVRIVASTSARQSAAVLKVVVWNEQ